MTLIDLRRRLERLEAGHHVHPPTGLLSDRPLDDDETADAVADWRALVASGRASLSSDVICLTGPQMTEADWTARPVTAH